MANTRADLLASVVELFEQVETKKVETMALVEEPNQSSRALLAESFSLFNATSGVVDQVFTALGYRKPNINPFADKQPAPTDTGLVVTDEHVAAASTLLELANKAFEAATAVHERYTKVRADNEAGNDIVQSAEPVIDDAFLADLSEKRPVVDNVRLTLRVLGERLTGLTAKYGDRTAAAVIFAAAAEGLVKGVGEDLTIASGEKLADEAYFEAQWEKACKEQEADPDPEFAAMVKAVGIETAKEFAFESMRMLVELSDYDSVGTRLGFLRSVSSEGALARAALNILATELSAVEPIHVDPCLLGVGANGAPSVEHVVPQKPTGCLIGRFAPGASKADAEPAAETETE